VKENITFEKKETSKTAKIADIIRLFFKYEIDFIPVIDSKNSFKGLILKNDLIDNSGDLSFIEKSFTLVLQNFLKVPNESEFLQIISKIKEETEFPVINLKGQVVHLWQKKNLLNVFYGISKSISKTETPEDVNFHNLLYNLPLKLIILNSKNKIIFATKLFLEKLDFKKELLLNQNITKFFPKINTERIPNSFYPKFYKIKYQHKDWYYTIFKIEDSSQYAYIFTESENINFDSEIFPRNETKEIETQKLKEPLPEIIENREKEIIEKTLKETDWNISEASRILKIPRQTLQYKISKYKIKFNE